MHVLEYLQSMQKHLLTHTHTCTPTATCNPLCSGHFSAWTQLPLNVTQQPGRPLLCPLHCPYTLVDTATLPRQLCLLHPGPSLHLHPTQFFQLRLPASSQVQKQLELVNRLSANWGWKIQYQSQWSKGMEQLSEEVRGRKPDLGGWRAERMRVMDSAVEWKPTWRRIAYLFIRLDFPLQEEFAISSTCNNITQETWCY